MLRAKRRRRSRISGNAASRDWRGCGVFASGARVPTLRRRAAIRCGIARGRDCGGAACAFAGCSQPRHDGWAVRQRAVACRCKRGLTAGLGGDGSAA
ncbi:hypothetical protein WS67_05735 [Burkholderia singularis]|uniref:Uncharacterized protein n=1 Tax=Burkholderia singularis TaxID=1503053 RepID=A0A103E6P4_9BURK|nr:hypothetical protein WS67_05735 [Burkholderia singularis]